MVLQKKQDYVKSLGGKLSTYDRAFIVNADNVTSKQLQAIRKTLRGVAELQFGKNTLMKYVISKLKETYPDLVKLQPHLKGNVGFVFTNGNLNEIKEVLLNEKVQAPAKADALAPSSVQVPKQVTTLGPEKTSFFQALQIPTKITRGTIEIINDVDLISEGDVVSASQAALLQMLKIHPFKYGLRITQVFEAGTCYSPEALDITLDDIKAAFMKQSQNVAAISLAIKRPTLVSVPHSIANTIKAVIAVAIAADYEMKEVAEIKEYLKDPSKFAVASVVTSSVEKTEEKAAPKEEVVEESDEEDSDIGMGLFD